MFTEKDILARLQAGEDAQKIADEMANILNAANKTYTDQKEAEQKRLEAERKAKEAAAKQTKARQKKEADALMEAIGKWVIKYYTTSPEEEKKYKAVLAGLDGAVLITIADEAINAAKLYSKMESIFDVKPVGKKKKTTDDVFADFFKEMGW